MSSELIINARPHETRVALIEHGAVVELHIERKTGQEFTGNIYRGRVIRVLPGMQAAFVDIGNVFDTVSDFSLSDLRKSAGVGVRIRNPFILLRFDYGFKLDAREGESSGAFHFGIGQAF